MQKIFRILLLFLFVLSFSFAFNVTQYLNATEIANMTKEYFTVNHTVYYIVNVSKTPTFLLKADELITDKIEIEVVLKSYYGATYSINTNDTNLLKTYFTTYNASRNNGNRFPGQEEDACRKALFLHLYPCIDNTSCLKTATLVCAGYSTATGCQSADLFLQPVKDFSFSSDGTELIMKEIFTILANINIENAPSYIAKLKQNMSTLKTYKEKMEKSIFRMPNAGETNSSCYGICPDIDFDDNSLSNAENLLTNLSIRIAPFVQYPLTAEKIYNNTKQRLETYANANTRLYYYSFYNPLKSSALKVKNNTREALLLVDNTNIRAKLTQLFTMETEIESAINSNNFSKVNASLAEYARAITLLNSSLVGHVEIYNNVSESYKSATVQFFFLEGKTLSAEDNIKFALLNQRKALLDTEFKKGLTATQYADLKQRYDMLIQDEKPIVSKQGAEQIMYIFTPMANRFVHGLDILLMQTRALTYFEKIESSKYLPIGLSALLFISFSSAVLFLFLIYYAITPKPMNKILLVILAMLLTFILGIIATGVYLALDKSTARLDYSEFMDLVKYTKNATIVVKLNGAENNQTLISMKACASSISKALSQKNISSLIYEMHGQNCTKSDKTAVQNCLDKNNNPLIVLENSVINSAKYSGLLTKQATISGDFTYHDLCLFSEAVKIS